MPDYKFQTPLPLILDISIPAGEIEIETVDGEESTVVVEGNEQLLDKLEVTHEGDRLLVRLRGKSKHGFIVQIGSLVLGNDSLRVRARIPHGADAKVKSTSADTRVSGRLQTLEVNSTSGDLRVHGDVERDAVLKTVSGDADLDGIGGNLSLQTVSGDLHSGPVGGSVDAKSVSGDVRVESVASGDARFASVSGDIEVGIAAGSLLDVDAGSSSGDLSSEVPLASDPPAGMGSESPTVVLRGRTVSGDVRIFRAR